MKKSFTSFFINSFSYVKKHHGESALLLCSLVYILLALSSDLFESMTDSGADVYITVALVELVVIALPAMLYYFLRSISTDGPILPCDVGAARVGKDKIFFTVLSSAALISGATAINAIVARLGVAPSNGIIEINGNVGGDVWLRILALAIIPAVSEEFLCRGVIMGELRALGRTRALLISSLCFAMLHFNLARFPLYLICGLILGGIMLVTDSLLATVAAHFAFNLFSLLSGGLLTTLSEQMGDLLMLFFLSAFIFIICIILIFRELSKIFFSYSKHPQNAPRAFSRNGSSFPKYSILGAITPPLALCVVLYLIFAILI